MKVTIDGRELEVENGTTILQAAQKVGVEIPTFCYHPGLSAPANCRMCLVNTNKAPKLLPACYATCMDGMEVKTNDEKTLRTRKSTLEFILLHHPVDCPICDQAGECVLQDNYFAHSAQPSRTFTRKNHKPKATPIGKNVILDAERCIVCTRCVRFCDEVSKTNELQVVNRGERSFVTTFPGRALDNDYATNTVDICPVGALTSRDFRFKMRVWFLKSVSSICSGCSKGCNITLDHGGGTTQRYRPRENQDVNRWWMCDPGRLSYKQFQESRLTDAQIDGVVHPVREAVGAAARRLRSAGDPSKVAIVPSLLMSNEDAIALAVLTKRAGFGAWYIGGRAPGKEDDLLQKADKNPNRAGVLAVAKAFGIDTHPLASLATAGAAGVLWFGHEHAADAKVLAAVQQLPRVVVVSNASEWTTGASVLLPSRTFEECSGTWISVDGRLQRFAAGPDAKGASVAMWDLCFRLLRALGVMDVMPPASPDQVVAEHGQVVPELSAMPPALPPAPGRPDQLRKARAA
ncbi:MAG: (2Fe-2S)-binding protein [Myxococcales bacterium]|nr:(2Fe-2S)-binding protein [Myxococcales bacterium]